ncbi:reticulon-like protein B11 [Carex rostrata]
MATSGADVTSRRSVHRSLGGGAVADVLLWRRRNVAVAAAVGSTAVWVLFERAGYNFLSVMANAFLLLVSILFFWAKSASLLNRPLPPLPNMEVSDAFVEKAASKANVWVNRLLAIAHDIAIKRDRNLFLQVIVVLWLVAYVGSFFNFLTLLYIGTAVLLVLPAIYDKHQDKVDEKVMIAHRQLSRHFDSFVATTRQPQKEKKTE